MELTSTSNVSTNKYELKLQVSPEEFNEAVNAVYKTESKKMNVPGFRKGHAPRAFIEKYYGPEVFYEAAVERLYRTMVLEAIDKSGLQVVSVGDFKVDEIGKETGIQCTITVITKPEVTIEEYKGIPVIKEAVAVSEGDIDHEIEHVRERNSRTITVEGRSAQDGDIVEIDFDGYVDGKPFDGGKAENYELTLGAGQFIPGFEDQVVGHNAGEEFDVNVTFPEDYHAEELKGKAAVFKIKLHEIKTKELPVVDDEFVKDVSEFDTVEAYRKNIEEDLLKRREQAADAEMENQIVDAVISKVQAEIPEEMVENETDEMINSFAYRLQPQGLNLETYLKYTNMDTNALREQYKPQADRQVKLRLGLEKIAQLENIQPTEEETEAEYTRLSEEYSMPLEQVKNLVTPENLNADIANRKVIDFLKENAVINPETPSEEETSAPKKKSSKKATNDEQPEEAQDEKTEG